MCMPAALVCLTAVLACSATGADEPDSGPSFEELDAANPVRPMPGAMTGHDLALADLPRPPDPEKARLGRWLFYDTRLSADDTISCASCHQPTLGFSEGTSVSTGIRGQMGSRKAPTFLNAAFAFYPETFWDGRAASLEEQAKGPIANPIEMGEDHTHVVAKIGAVAGYGPFFKRAFGDPRVTIDRIAAAIADYERTRLSGNSPVDRWRAADEDDPGADRIVGDEVKLGHDLFFDANKGNCATCHVGNHFTDSRYHNLGIGYDLQTGAFTDVGRYAVTGKKADRGAFKTPTLREVALRAPYMHDGSLASLREVIEHYRRGGTPNPHLSPKMKALDLNGREVDALVAFLEALSGEGFLDTPPALFPQ